MKSNEINSSLEYIPPKRGISISDILEVSESVRYQGRIFDAAETLAHMRSDAPRWGTWIQPRKKASSTRRRASMTWSLRRRSGRYWSRRVIRATTVERQHVGTCRLRSIELADDLHSRWRNSHQCQQSLPNSLFPHYSHCRRQTGFKEIPSLALTGASFLAVPMVLAVSVFGLSWLKNDDPIPSFPSNKISHSPSHRETRRKLCALC